MRKSNNISIELNLSIIFGGNFKYRDCLKDRTGGLPSGSSKSSKGINLEENSSKFGISLY